LNNKQGLYESQEGMAAVYYDEIYRMKREDSADEFEIYRE